MLVIVSVGTVNYVKSRKRETQVRGSIQKQKKTCRVVYWTKCKDQNKADQKYDLFKIAKRTVKTNRDTTGGQCIRDGILEIGDEDKKLT